MTELLPCPFCGEMRQSHWSDMETRTMFLRCLNCGACGPGVSTISNDPNDAKARLLAVRDQWNKRGGEWKAEHGGTPIRKVDNA